MRLDIEVTQYKGKPPSKPLLAVFKADGGTIGRAAENNLYLPDPVDRAVSSKHATIRFENGVFYIRDHSLNKTYLNDKEYHECEARLADGDQLEIGDYVLKISITDFSEPSPPFPASDNVFTEGPTRDQEPSLPPFDATCQDKTNEVPVPVSEDDITPDTPFDPLPVTDAPFLEQLGKTQEQPSGPPPDFNVADLMPPLDEAETSGIGTDSLISTPPSWESEAANDFDFKEKTLSLDDFQPEAPDLSEEKTAQLPEIHPDPYEITPRQTKLPEGSGSENVTTVQPDTVKPDVIEPDAVRPDAVKPDVVKPDAVKPDAVKPDVVKPDAVKPDVVKPDAVKPDVVRPDVIKSDNELIGLFFDALGIVDEKGIAAEEIPEFIQTLGIVLKELVEGLMTLLRARSEIKQDFRIVMTMIQKKENNPLKFLPTAEDVLRHMLIRKNSGFMDAVTAVREGYNDLKNHELAITAGAQSALRELLIQLEPQRFEKKYEKTFLGKKAKCWDEYTKAYNQIVKETPESFFDKEFTSAYEKLTEAVDKANKGIPHK